MLAMSACASAGASCNFATVFEQRMHDALPQGKGLVDKPLNALATYGWV